MRAEGLEPTRISPQAPKTCASANSATPALPAFCRNCGADAIPLTGALGQDRDGVAKVEQVVELLDLRNSHGNATVGPGDVGAGAVQADFAAKRGFPRGALPAGNGGADCISFGSGNQLVAFAAVGVLDVWIAQAEKSMVAAGRVFVADVKLADRGGEIAFADFVGRILAGHYREAQESLVAIGQCQSSVVLGDDDAPGTHG